MSPARRFWFIRVTLAVVAAAAVFTLLRLDLRRRITTDVLDLIPTAERDPELAVVRELAAQRSARVALFALDLPAGSTHRDAASRAFLTALQHSGAFADVVPMADASARDELGRQVFTQRFDLLLPAWLAERRRAYDAAHPTTPWSEWLANDTATRLEQFLPTPEALALQDLVPADPLLLIGGLVTKLPSLPAPAATADGPELIWALAKAPPLSEEGQQPVLTAVAAALHEAQAIEPGAHLRWSAIARFAAQSRERIQHELSGLNLLSLVAVFVVGAVGLCQLWRAVHLVPVVIGGLLGAWVVTLLSFAQVHVLVFVVGSLLAGVAIDYGFYLSLQPPAYADEPYGSRVRRLLKPLLSSALTTILGFSLLLFSELPLIRQLGVFVSAGLLCSLATALAWFGQVPRPFVATRAFIRARPPRSPRTRGFARVALLLAAVVALAGPWTLQWHDDVRELEIPAPRLRAEANAVQALFGDDPTRALFITHGTTAAAARDALGAFQHWYTAQAAGQPLASLGLVLPTAADYDGTARRLAGLDHFPADLQHALAQHGFSAESFEPFARDWAAWRAAPRPSYDAAVARLAGALHGPLSLLMSVSDRLTWFASVASPLAIEPPAGVSTVSVHQLQNLNRLFSRYRVSALRLSSIGLIALGLSVLALYGVREGWRIFAVPCGACLFTFGLLGLSGHTLNLFHLLGAFLGVCLSHNYAIFSAENARRHEESPPSVRLSALTTAASFGVLALSQIPVVSALGTTVALIVLSALIIVELEPLTHRPAVPPPS